MGRPWFVGRVVAAVAVVVATGAADPTTTTRTSNAATDPGALVLAGQTPWIAPGGDALLRLRVKGNIDGLEIAATIHRAVTTRSQLLDTIAARRLGGVEGLVTDAVANLPIDANGDRVLTIPVQDPALPRNPARVSLARGASAIYPVEVELRRTDSDRPVDQFVTHLPVLGTGIQPLTTALVWRLDSTPAHRPNGALTPAARRDLAPGGRLTRLVDALTAFPDVAVTVAPTPETLEAWVDSAPRAGDPASSPAITALRAMTGSNGRQFATSPYVPVDIPSLEAAGLGDETAAQFARAEDALRATLAIRPDPRTVVVGTVDANGLARLRDVGADRVVVDPATVPLTSRLTQARPFTITSRGRTFTTAVTDPGLRDLLKHPDDAPALRAQRFLTGLVLVALEAPSDARGVVVETPPSWDAPAAMVDAILAGIRSTPVLRADTLDGFFTTVAPDGRGTRPRTLTTRGVATDRVAVDRDAVRAARRRINAFSHLAGDDASVAPPAERNLLLAETAATTPAERRANRAYLSGVDTTINAVLGRVVGPAGRTVTLTARRASIPISLLNANSQALQVRVHLRSDKLIFPKGDSRLLTLQPRNTTERFPVEARTSGAFPLTILVTSPDGELVVTSSQLTVRSTAVSGVGVFLAGGAGAFLFGWWGTHIRRRGIKRTRTLASPNVPGAADTADTPTSTGGLDIGGA